MDITQEIKELFNDTELSEETLTQMNTLLSTTIQSKTDALSEEIVALKVQIAELTEQHKLELEEMETKANEYGAFLQEKANEYGTFLQEKADEYGTFLQEKADEYGNFLQEKANAYGEYVIEELSDKVDDYTSYVVEKFVDEHKSNLLEQAEYDRMKKLFEDVKTSFELNHFKLNEEVKQLDSEDITKLEESTKAYNELYGEFVNTKKQLEDMQFSMIFESMTRDLTDTQKERINNLIKNVSFSSIAEFKRGVELMVEEISTSSKSVQLNEIEYQQDIIDSAPQKPIDDKMQKYINHL